MLRIRVAFCLLMSLSLVAGCKQKQSSAPERVSPSPASHPGPSSAPPSRSSEENAGLTRRSGPVAFTDVTAQAGIRFHHNSGAFGRKYLPETMGSGVCFLDYDN